MMESLVLIKKADTLSPNINLLNADRLPMKLEERKE